VTVFASNSAIRNPHSPFLLTACGSKSAIRNPHSAFLPGLGKAAAILAWLWRHRMAREGVRVLGWNNRLPKKSSTTALGLRLNGTDRQAFRGQPVAAPLKLFRRRLPSPRQDLLRDQLVAAPLSAGVVVATGEGLGTRAITEYAATKSTGPDVATGEGLGTRAIGHLPPLFFPCHLRCPERIWP
jgi:hypothetical protein